MTRKGPKVKTPQNRMHDVGLTGTQWLIVLEALDGLIRGSGLKRSADIETIEKRIQRRLPVSTIATREELLALEARRYRNQE